MLNYSYILVLLDSYLKYYTKWSRPNDTFCHVADSLQTIQKLINDELKICEINSMSMWLQCIYEQNIMKKMCMK